MSATVVISIWIILGCVAASCGVGFAACALAGRQGPVRGGTPNPPRRSQQPPRTGYVILADPDPGMAATSPQPWPAVPEHLHSDQLAALAALNREVSDMAAEAWKLYRP